MICTTDLFGTTSEEASPPSVVICVQQDYYLGKILLATYHLPRSLNPAEIFRQNAIR